MSEPPLVNNPTPEKQLVGTSKASGYDLNEYRTPGHEIDVSEFELFPPLEGEEASEQDTFAMLQEMGVVQFLDDETEAQKQEKVHTVGLELKNTNNRAVYTIGQLCWQMRHMLRQPQTAELFSREKSMFFTVLKVLKYYFQVPFDHDDAVLRSVSATFLQIRPVFVVQMLKLAMQASQMQDKTFWKMRKVSLLLVALCTLNMTLCDSLVNAFSDAKNMALLRSVCSVRDPECGDAINEADGPLTIYEHFQRSEVFEDNMGNKSGQANLLVDICLHPGSPASVFHSIEYLVQIRSLGALARKTDSLSVVLEIVADFFTSQEKREIIVLETWHDEGFFVHFQRLYADVQNTPQYARELLAYFLRELCIEMVVRFPAQMLAGTPLHVFIQAHCSTQCAYVLAVQDNLFQEAAGVGWMHKRALFLPLFEIVNHNFKLDLPHERNLLLHLDQTLGVFKSWLDSQGPITEVFKVLDDLGCSLSFNALLDYVQFILAVALSQEMPFHPGDSARMMEQFKESFALETIPPIARANDLMEDFVHSDIAVPADLCDVAATRRADCVRLIKRCLIDTSVVRVRTGRLLSELGGQVVSRSSHSLDESWELYTSVADTGYSLVNFKQGTTLDYRLAHTALDVALKADLSLLAVAEGYRREDRRFASTLSSMMVDTLLSVTSIYGEFGVLAIFDMFSKVCQRYLYLANSAAIVLAEMLPNEKVVAEVPERKRAYRLALEQSTLGSNMIRLFSENLDDGRTLSYKKLINFMRIRQSSLKPNKRPRGTVNLPVDKYVEVLRGDK